MIAGNLDESGAFPRTIDWTIPDFFQLPQHAGFAVYSPEYNFMEMKCRIRKEGLIRWELEVRRENGTVLRKCTGCSEDTDEMEMCMRIPVEDVEKGCSAQGFMKITCRLYHEDGISYYAVENKNDKNSQTGEMTNVDKLSCDMEELMLREDYCDVIMKVKDREYKAHKAIFGIRSPVFMNMFKYQMYENITGVVDIDDCDAVTFREFMRYIYASRVTKYSPKVLLPLHQVADKYQVTDLKAYCLEQIKSSVSVDNFCDSAVLCFQYNEERFMDIVSEFLAENMTEIRKTEEWKNFYSENPDEAHKLVQKALKCQELTGKFELSCLQKLVKAILG